MQLLIGDKAHCGLSIHVLTERSTCSANMAGFSLQHQGLASFQTLLLKISSRVTKGRQLLDELKSIGCESGASMQPIIDRIGEELGDQLVKAIKDDPTLTAALEGKEVEQPAVEEVEEPQNKKASRKRRKTTYSVSLRL